MMANFGLMATAELWWILVATKGRTGCSSFIATARGGWRHGGDGDAQAAAARVLQVTAEAGT
uniref:DUF834 domain-containing protein n=1 Tax=Oryza meridionalis TaxID=40149 RepID=A0A0E0E9P5_9ORYZ